MKNYEDLLLERVQNLTGKLAQKQREGCLTEELALCVRLAQLHSQLDSPKVSVQFWQSCMQIATDLEEEEEIWRAAAEISKIYCKEGQIDEAENFMTEHLKSVDEPVPLRLSLLKSEVITAMAPKTRELSVKAFSAYERALKVLDEALEQTTNENIWWWDSVAFRAELLMKLGKFDESRYEEAIDVVNAIQSSISTDSSDSNDSNNSNVLLSLKCKYILAKIYFEMKEYATALESAICVIDKYKSDDGNANYRSRRRIYCEMLLLAGRVLRFQKDFNFSLQNLLLAKDEATALAVEKEFMEEISVATQETIEAKSAADEATTLQRRKNLSTKELEELADKFGIIGDFEGQLELLEKCQKVATNETTRKRIEKKLINLYFNEMRNWSAVLRTTNESDDWRVLLLKGRACVNLGKLDEAEEFLLTALRESKGILSAQAALYFYYRQRGKKAEAEKFEAEALSLETIFNISTKVSRSCLIDPNFSYFATRKPSNSLMKMVGSGMVMRTKTRKTKGLQLKRRRGPSKLRSSTGSLPKMRRCEGDGGSEVEDDGLSDFIVSDEESDSGASESETRKLETKRSLVILSSSDSDCEPATPRSPGRRKRVQQYGLDSPLMIQTDNLDGPLVIKGGSPVKIDFDDEFSDCNNIELYSTQSNSYTQRSTQSNSYMQRRTQNSTQRTVKVIVRFKKGIEVLIPTAFDVTVKELMNSAQMRLNRLFPEESKQLGQICGLSLSTAAGSAASTASAMLFPDDRLDLILSRDSETLQAHFKQENNKLCDFNDSPSKLNSIEEDFKRKQQILNLKRDGNSEIKILKMFQNRFRNFKNQILDLSALSLDSNRISEYSNFINKFMKLSGNLKELNLSENLLCDEDLKFLNFSLFFKNCEKINFSLNFLQRPNFKQFSNCDFIDFSYNPIDVTWLISNMGHFKGLNLIGCFELPKEEGDDEEVKWKELAAALSSLKKLKISLPPSTEIQNDFFSNLCPSELEEIEFFAVEWQKPENLVEVSYLNKLKSLKFTACAFDEVAAETLSKVLKRNFNLESVEFSEIEMAEGGWPLIQQGIGNIKQVIKDGC